MNLFKKCYLFLIFSFLGSFLCSANLDEQIKRYYLDDSTPFIYEHKTEVVYSNYKNSEYGDYEIGVSFELPQAIENYANEVNSFLDRSLFFNTKFVRNPKSVRQYYLNPQTPLNYRGEIVSIKTEDGVKLNCTFFNRGSNKLLIVGGGFTNEREIMIPFVAMFPDYDLVLMEYRGHGYKDFNVLNPTTWFDWPIKSITGADVSKVGLGKFEEKDVFAIVNKFKNQKRYEKVFGLGVCYSALIYIKAQTIWQQEHANEQDEYYKNLFNDGIVADGCWLSVENFVDKLVRDPKKIFSPQYGGWGDYWLVRKLWFQRLLKFITQKLFYVKFNEISILDYLPQLKDTPILFFYGKNDLVIDRQEFEIIWNAAQTSKTAIITSNPHVINHIKQKELYKLICESFFDLSQENFIQFLQGY